MKNKIKFLGTQSRWLLSTLCAIALVAVIGFSFTACDNGGGGSKPTPTQTQAPNTEPKVVKITGIDAGVKASNFDKSTGAIGLFPVGTTIEQMYAGSVNYVAGAAFTNQDITKTDSAPFTYTIPLYNPGDNSGRWTGNGTYDLWLSDSQTSPVNVYKAGSVVISAKETTLAFSRFTKVELE